MIWRIGRLWAMMCGIEVIDNLSRCVCNNYGFEGFWRMWHRGFNQWLVRYLYVPLGGRNRLVLSTVSTIAFVAFWHDHSLSVVLWAFTFIIFILPELLVKRYARCHWKDLFSKTWFKYLSAFASSIYIYLLVISNIIGFGYGAENAYLLLQKIGDEWASVVWSISVLTCAVMLMFYQRKMEGDKGY
jgi:D-alanyl-lipoteichoic acid acyltransferase DltB (MBOAT superfamily)